MNKKPVSFAYSPDSDDAFMIMALKDGIIPWDEFEFEFHVDDIQVLNDKARSARFDVTALSAAALPAVGATYELMPIGGSVGDGFGPAVIVKTERAADIRARGSLAGMRVATPGRLTSAGIASFELLGPFTAMPMHFMEIAPAVVDGTADAGVLIHELQIDCDDGRNHRGEPLAFTKIFDLGKLWRERFQLPLPLGINAIKSSLGKADIARITDKYRQSITYGLAHRETTLKQALAQSTATVDLATGDRYISMYVNDRSLEVENDLALAMDKLWGLGKAQSVF